MDAEKDEEEQEIVYILAKFTWSKIILASAEETDCIFC